jgi:hypothetical protein
MAVFLLQKFPAFNLKKYWRVQLEKADAIHPQTGFCTQYIDHLSCEIILRITVRQMFHRRLEENSTTALFKQYNNELN